MKKLSLLFIALVAAIATSCSGYNEKTAQALVDKIENDVDLTDDEIDQALDQCDAIEAEVKDQLEKIGELVKGSRSDAEKGIDMLDDFQDDDNTMMEHFSKLASALERYNNSGRLKGDVKKRYKELEKQGEKIGKLYRKVKKAARRAERRIDDDDYDD